MTPSETLIAKALAHARETPGVEVCALVVQGAYIRCRNVAANPADDFVIHPDDQADAEDLGEIEWVVHSHPVGGPAASEADKACCDATGKPWLIVTPAGNWHVQLPRGIVNFEGRDFAYGVSDCTTLLRDWYKAERGVDIEVFKTQEGWWERLENCLDEGLEANGFKRVPTDALQVGDVLTMALEAPVPHHVAIWLGEGKILHQLRHRKSRIEFFHDHWQSRTVAAWRHST